MRVSTHTKSSIVGRIDQVSGLGLKVGIPVLLVATAFLLLTAFGNHIRDVKITATDRLYLLQSTQIAMSAFRISGIVVVASAVMRIFNAEILGQVLSILGALLYFGSPALFEYFTKGSQLQGNTLFLSIVNEFRFSGQVCLLPGLFLVLRDAILRIWTGVSVKRILERRWGDEEERSKKQRKPKLYGKCWDMPFCRDFVRRVCPAFIQKKPCWRIKVGCYCDEETILKAMTSYGTDNVHARGIMQSLGLDKARKSLMSSRQKRARCRRCGIYAEHQRQKYRILSPLVFPAVGALLYGYYSSITAWLWVALESTDKFMRFLTYKSGSASYSFTSDGHILTILAVIWLAIITVSYTLRVLEYMIFELQV